MRVTPFKLKVITTSWLAVAIIVLGVTACSNAPVQRPDSNAAENEADKQHRQFAEELTRWFRQGDTHAIRQAFDVDTFIARVNDNVELGLKGREQLAEQKDAVGDRTVLAMIMNKTAKTVAVDLLQVQRRQDGYWASLRLDYGAGGVGYLDFLIVRNNGETRFADYHDYLVGLSLSETTAELYRFFGLSDVHPGLTGRDSRNFRRMNSAMRSGDKHGVLRYSNLLSPRVRGTALVQAHRLRAAVSTGDRDTTRRVFEEFFNHRGRNAENALAQIDYHARQRDTAKLRKAIGKLESRIGPEPSLHVTVADLQFSQGQRQSARRTIRQAMTQDRDFEPTYWAALSVLVHYEAYQSAVFAWKNLEQRFGYNLEPEQFVNQAKYGPFFASSAFKSEYTVD